MITQTAEKLKIHSSCSLPDYLSIDKFSNQILLMMYVYLLEKENILRKLINLCKIFEPTLFGK